MQEKEIEVGAGNTMNFKKDDVCGTILTNGNFTGAGVQLIKEQVNRIGGLYDTANQKHQAGSIYDKEGLAPTLDTASGGHRQPFIVEDIEYIPLDEQNGYLRKDGCVGTLTTDGSSPNHNNRIVELNGKHPYELTDAMKKYIVSKDDKYRVSNGNLKVNRDIACSKTTREGCTRADASDYISPDLMPNENIANKNPLDFRIRKLTPKECGRLMGVKDEDIDKMSVNQSNSKLYHLYGDSIVVDVLMEIFREVV